MIGFLRVTLFAALSAATSLVAASNPPAVTYQSMLNMSFDDSSGQIRVSKIDLAFAPEGKINAAVALVDSSNKVIKSYGFYPDAKMRDTVFARLLEKGPAFFEVDKPGTYNVVFFVDGKPVSRLPVLLQQTDDGGDPFNPTKKLRYLGMWSLYGFLKFDSVTGDEPFPKLYFWVGGQDLAAGKKSDRFSVWLKSQGKIIAHSKRSMGSIDPQHYRQKDIFLYQPHDPNKEARAKPFTLKDWTEQNGEYDLEVIRQSDNAVIRRFVVTVEEGQLKQLPQATLGFEPRVDFIVPRVHDNSQRFRFVEAIWLKTRSGK